jgi:hypothetical protein
LRCVVAEVQAADVATRGAAGSAWLDHTRAGTVVERVRQAPGPKSAAVKGFSSTMTRLCCLSQNMASTP